MDDNPEKEWGEDGIVAYDENISSTNCIASEEPTNVYWTDKQAVDGQPSAMQQLNASPSARQKFNKQSSSYQRHMQGVRMKKKTKRLTGAEFSIVIKNLLPGVIQENVKSAIESLTHIGYLDDKDPMEGPFQNMVRVNICKTEYDTIVNGFNDICGFAPPTTVEMVSSTDVKFFTSQKQKLLALEHGQSKGSTQRTPSKAATTKGATKFPYRVRISNIPAEMPYEELKENIESNLECQVVVQLTLAPNGSHTGSGFLLFEKQENALDAIDLMDGVDMCGHEIHLEMGTKHEEKNLEIHDAAGKNVASGSKMPALRRVGNVIVANDRFDLTSVTKGIQYRLIISKIGHDLPVEDFINFVNDNGKGLEIVLSHNKKKGRTWKNYVIEFSDIVHKEKFKNEMHGRIYEGRVISIIQDVSWDINFADRDQPPPYQKYSNMVNKNFSKGNKDSNMDYGNPIMNYKNLRMDYNNPKMNYMNPWMDGKIPIMDNYNPKMDYNNPGMCSENSRMDYNLHGNHRMDDNNHKMDNENPNIGNMPPSMEIFGISPDILKTLNISLPLVKELLVSNLDSQVTEGDIKDLFAVAGSVVKVQYDPKMSNAIVEMSCEEDAVEAISMLHFQEYFDKIIEICMLRQSVPESVISSVPRGLKTIGQRVSTAIPKPPARESARSENFLPQTRVHNDVPFSQDRTMRNNKRFSTFNDAQEHLPKRNDDLRDQFKSNDGPQLHRNQNNDNRPWDDASANEKSTMPFKYNERDSKYSRHTDGNSEIKDFTDPKIKFDDRTQRQRSIKSSDTSSKRSRSSDRTVEDNTDAPYDNFSQSNKMGRWSDGHRDKYNIRRGDEPRHRVATRP